MTWQAGMLDEVDLAHSPEPSNHRILYSAKLSPIRNGMGEC